MAFTEQDRLEQQKAFEAVQDEFSRLNARLDGMCKDAGLSGADLKQSLAAPKSPELETALNKAKAEAEQAGKARAAQAGAAQTQSSKPAGHRPGAVRI
jgi:hypothetical protein